MIIGVTGYIGAGKGEFVNILQSRNYRYVSVSFKDAIVREAKRRGIPVDRTSLQDLGKKLESEEGEDVWAKRVINGINIREHYNPGQDYVVECFRTPEQVRTFRKEFDRDFYLVAVTADFDTRWRRVLSRGRIGDPELIDEFRDIDHRDRGMGDNPVQNTGWCVTHADFFLVNDYNLLFPFKRDINRFMRRIGKQ